MKNRRKRTEGANKKAMQEQERVSPQKLILPKDIITAEIFPRLPVKSLVRFKSVSKHWNSWISDPEYAMFHLRRRSCLTDDGANDRPVLNVVVRQYDYSKHERYQITRLRTLKLYSSDLEKAISDSLMVFSHESHKEKHKWDSQVSLQDDISLDYDFSRQTYILGSTNGLICYGFFGSLHHHSFNNFGLWNPATKELRHIKGPCLSFTYNLLQSGFGYVSSSNEYKMVLIGRHVYQRRGRRGKIIGHICTLSTNTWRKLDMSELPTHEWREYDTFCFHPEEVAPVVVGGKWHWPMLIKDRDCAVLTLDMASEIMNMLVLPTDVKTVSNRQGDFFVSEIRQCLCACWLANHDGVENDMEVWMLERYGDWGSWKVLFKLTAFRRFFSHNCITIEPYFYETEDDSGRLVMFDRPCACSRAFVVDLNRDDRQEPIQVYMHLLYVRSMVSYTESLVSPYCYSMPSRRNAAKKLGFY